MLEDLGILVFTGKDLRDLRADDVLLQVRVQVRVLVRHELPGLTLLVLDPEHEDREDRHTDENDERELDVGGDHERDDEDQVDDLEDRVDQAVAEHVADGVDVVNDTDQDLTVRTVVVVLEREFLKMREKIFSDVIHDVLRHALHDVRADRVEDDTYGVRDDQEKDQHMQAVLIL